MKRIRIYGCTHEQQLKKVVHSVSECFIRCLIPLKKKYDITITLYDNLIDEEGAYGECWHENKNSFCIRIEKKLDSESLIKTIAHEFVHLKQFARGELKFLSKYDVWNGKIYYHDTSYEMAPWEREASEFEDILYTVWKESL